MRAQVRQVVEIVQASEATLKLPPVMLEPVRELRDLAAIEAIARSGALQPRAQPR